MFLVSLHSVDFLCLFTWVDNIIQSGCMSASCSIYLDLTPLTAHNRWAFSSARCLKVPGCVKTPKHICISMVCFKVLCRLPTINIPTVIVLGSLSQNSIYFESVLFSVFSSSDLKYTSRQLYKYRSNYLLNEGVHMCTWPLWHEHGVCLCCFSWGMNVYFLCIECWRVLPSSN